MTRAGQQHSRIHSGLHRVVAGALLLLGVAAISARGQEAAAELESVYRAPTDPGDLLKVDELMWRFFRERISTGDPSPGNLRLIVDAILRPDGLNFAYDAEGTFDALETFRRRRGNCVSFSFLVVAVARKFGFTAHFRDSTNGRRWNRYGDVIVSAGHMNVRVETTGATYVVDLRPDLAGGYDSDDMRVVRDNRAFAQFYYTVGFFELLHGRTEEALQYTILATTTDPDCAAAWANLGVMHARFGDLVAARENFERSLREDPRLDVALDGFVGVLRRLGSPEDLRIAARLERRAQSIRNRNPYFQLHLAERAQQQGDWETAERLLRRAIALKDDEPVFYEQWVAVLHQLGRDDAARRAASRLERVRGS